MNISELAAQAKVQSEETKLTINETQKENEIKARLEVLQSGFKVGTLIPHNGMWLTVKEINSEGVFLRLHSLTSKKMKEMGIKPRKG